MRQKILIIKNDGIGDLILCSGIITELSQKYHIDLLTCIENKEIAESINGVMNKIYVSREFSPRIDKIKSLLKLTPFENLTLFNQFFTSKLNLDAIKFIKNVKYEMVIVLRRYIRNS